MSQFLAACGSLHLIGLLLGGAFYFDRRFMSLVEKPVFDLGTYLWFSCEAIILAATYVWRARTKSRS
jgi:hypothetical protein